MNLESINSTPMDCNGPIGVFDSGIGGLSVLRHIHAQLPHEHLLYFADSGFAPYGNKPEAVIVDRSLQIAQFLLQRGAKALVVACNTATAASIKALRELYPALPVVGVEPGLKPAAAISQTRIVGVLATERTLASEKFKLLQEQIAAATNVHFLLQACVGLADQIEKGELDSPATRAMVTRFVSPLLQQGADTLVLGCTHYPFVQPLIEEIVKDETAKQITIIDTGDAVARQLTRLLAQHRQTRIADDNGSLHAFTTASQATLSAVFASLLNLHPEVMQIALTGSIEASQ
ncbi:MAG TPA: glutamate racemase [Burkholderiaceae bacterium]|jgi:glutamate racemase